MPNRILREGILESQRVNRLTESEEVFYRRLMSIVDDYGRYEAHPSLLLARLYPLKLNQKGEADVARYLNATTGQRLAFTYQAVGKVFLQLLSFRQQTRSESRFPSPDAKQLKSFDRLAPCTCYSDSLKLVCASCAKHVLANAHLGVVVFGCDVVVGVVSEGVVVSGAAEAAQTTTDVPLSDRKPENIEAVIGFGTSLGLSDDESRKFFQYNRTRGWKATREPGSSWRELMRSWQERGAEGVGRGRRAAKNSSNGDERPFDPKKPHAHTGGLPIV